MPQESQALSGLGPESVLVLGGTGTLGQELCRQPPWPVVALGRKHLDLAVPSAAYKFVRQVRPRAVVHAAAWTDVDGCEKDPQLCFQVNAHSVAEVAQACRELNIPLVFISTNFVFGSLRKPSRAWREQDPVCPRGVYAQSKHLGEEAARRCPQHLIVRTCGLYGHEGRRCSFVQRVLDQACRGEVVRVVEDQWANPTWVPELAQAIWFLLRLCLRSGEHWGTYHVVNTPAVSWYEFARAVVRWSGLHVPVEPIRSHKLNLAVERPRYAALDTTKYHRLGGPRMSHTLEALRRYLAGGSSWVSAPVGTAKGVLVRRGSGSAL